MPYHTISDLKPKEDSCSTYTQEAEDKKGADCFKVVPFSAVLDMIEGGFPGTERVQSFQYDSSSHGADEAFPHRLVGEVVRYLLLKSATLLLRGTVGHGPTSRLNSTPPIGAPKATDMPDAAAAESTSLFRAVLRQMAGLYVYGRILQYLHSH